MKGAQEGSAQLVKIIGPFVGLSPFYRPVAGREDEKMREERFGPIT